MLFGTYVVAHVGALHPEDNVLGDVGGVVGNALQIARYEERVEGLPHDFGTLVHRLDELDEGIILHAIDDVIHFEDGLGQFGFAFDERFQGSTHHGADGGAHAADIHGKIGGGKIDHVHHALGDVYPLVPHTLQIRLNFRYREDKA